MTERASAVDLGPSSPTGGTAATEPVVRVEDLTVSFATATGPAHAVNGISYAIAPGEVVGLVGESGSGKSASALALLGLLPAPPRCTVRGEVRFEGQNLLALSPRRLRHIRGRRIAVVFQDPMSALNPVHTVGAQIAEAIRTHQPSMRRAEVRRRAVELLDLVGVPNARRRAGEYPHEYSGGMRQRAMIAMAVANEPRLLIADEPTTALDVTIQAQILDVFRTVSEATGTAMLLITHDFGLIAEIADRVMVMYAGRIVETGTTGAVFDLPRHPYTRGLMRSRPSLDGRLTRLESIPGEPPDIAAVPTGCAFAPRCPLHQDRSACRTDLPVLRGSSHLAACHFQDELVAATASPAADAVTAGSGMKGDEA